METTATEIFSTLDLYTAAYLTLAGISPALTLTNGRVAFQFPVTPDLYRNLDRFNRNEPVPCLDFTTELKTLRARMLAARNGR
ncbi:MAG: hypothetical protein FD174_2868 [Geobacteraceae bacterium]|nr:MAG: hypothetical protein FD174_2868 [Geobacteraceae bacterium]